MASKEMTAIIEWAKGVAAAAPKLELLEGLDSRIAQQKKAIEDLQTQHNGLQAAIQEKKNVHENLIENTKKAADEIITSAKVKAGEIIANAQTKGDGIVAQAQHNAQSIEDGYAAKQLELNDLIEKTKQAHVTHDNIKYLLKNLDK